MENLTPSISMMVSEEIDFVLVYEDESRKETNKKGSNENKE